MKLVRSPRAALLMLTLGTAWCAHAQVSPPTAPQPPVADAPNAAVPNVTTPNVTTPNATGTDAERARQAAIGQAQARLVEAQQTVEIANARLAAGAVTRDEQIKANIALLEAHIQLDRLQDHNAEVLHSLQALVPLQEQLLSIVNERVQVGTAALSEADAARIELARTRSVEYQAIVAVRRTQLANARVRFQAGPIPQTQIDQATSDLASAIARTAADAL